MHKKRVGDGTTSAVLFAIDLYDQIIEVLEKYPIHRNVIIEHLHECALISRKLLQNMKKIINFNSPEEDKTRGFTLRKLAETCLYSKSMGVVKEKLTEIGINYLLPINLTSLAVDSSTFLYSTLTGQQPTDAEHRIINIQLPGKSSQQSFWTPTISWVTTSASIAGLRPPITSCDRDNWFIYTQNYEIFMSCVRIPILVLDCEILNGRQNLPFGQEEETKEVEGFSNYIINAFSQFALTLCQKTQILGVGTI
jgi:hypothetical protein